MTYEISFGALGHGFLPIRNQYFPLLFMNYFVKTKTFAPHTCRMYINDGTDGKARKQERRPSKEYFLSGDYISIIP